ncbi:hypothetical protein M440DRAFT_77822 [Trichoderma longibrachiatum ATCC 18648]|uniref:Uncharacterized protein n=1 Tax=Trichoderma longibrachiatum ATCC 18648 TaxID=983965 RepID=A0A2T4CHW1_TRILO|nr:hypothetical protein M440DRAFT_77822 [Trichoderma longibrachiatum ATCC 18648]
MSLFFAHVPFCIISSNHSFSFLFPAVAVCCCYSTACAVYTQKFDSGPSSWPSNFLHKVGKGKITDRMLSISKSVCAFWKVKVDLFPVHSNDRAGGRDAALRRDADDGVVGLRGTRGAV